MAVNKKINTAARFAEARIALGNPSKADLARALRLSERDGRETIRRYETGDNARGIPGPVQIVMEAFLTGYRPRGVKFPCDVKE